MSACTIAASSDDRRSSLTRTVRELARRTGLRFEPLGAVALRGLPEWELFEASVG